MLNLTINILIKEDYFDENNLLALKKLKYPIQVGYVNLSEDRLKFCLLNNIKTKKLTSSDYQHQKNELMQAVKTDWMLFLEPWETILKNQELLESLNDPKAYHIQILNNKEVLTKEVRLFHKKLNLAFKNPVFEHIETNSEFLPLIVNSSHLQTITERLNEWEGQNRLNPIPVYYKAIEALKRMNIIEFKKYSDNYLFIETNKQKMSYVMCKYYKALIDFYNDKNYQKSIKSTLECLCANPLMAEFWCLLGDIHYDLNQYDKAIEFYKNAIYFGEERYQDDLWPLHIPKYKKYPLKMIDACKEIKQKTKNLFLIKNV